MVEVEMRTLSELAASSSVDPQLRFCAVDGLAFGAPVGGPWVEAKRRIMDPDRFVLAVLPPEPGTDGRAVDTTAIDSTAIDSTAIDSTAIDSTAIDSTAIDVGGSGNFPFHLTVPGGASLPVAGVGDVGVLASHRRRGVLRSMMTWLLDDAVARGEVASLLTASQATIYGRFGYGVAERHRGVEIPLAGAVLRDDVSVADGTLRIHDVAADLDQVQPVLAALHARSAAAGSLSRTPTWWSVVLGDVDTYVGGQVDQRALIHHDASGRPDAYALFRPVERWTENGSDGEVELREVVGTTPEAELAVWHALLDDDLVQRIRVQLPVRHLLDDSLVDVRALRCHAVRDHLWLRPLDVAALLSARTYSADGVLTLSVADAFRPAAGGTFRLEVRAGTGTCERTSSEPAPSGACDLALGPAELGSRYLGDGSFRALARAGRAQGSAPGLALADAMFSTDPPAWTDTRF